MSYHHGDARIALLTAAQDWLEEIGANALSIRGVAERAGLSRQAPYNHFADKQDMLAALVTDGFEKLTADLCAAVTGCIGAIALTAAGDAYIAFAQRGPALFRLMFTRELVDVANYPHAKQASTEAFDTLARIIRTLVPPEHHDDVALAAWSIVHGYATLCNEAGLEPSERRGERARLFARLVLSGEYASQNHADA